MSNKVWDRAAVVDLLERSDKAVVKAILALYARQTSAEQSSQHTNVQNGRGFNKVDAPFLSSVAQALPRWNNHMTVRQLARARRILPKYWRQLAEVAQQNGHTVDMKRPKPVQAQPERYGAF